MNPTGTVKFTSHRGDQIPGFDDGDDKTRLLSDEQQR